MQSDNHPTHSLLLLSLIHIYDTVKDATAFLETFFKLYPTATEKELAYYVKDGVLAPVSGDYVFSELVNPVFTKAGDNLKVNVSVKYLDNKSKMTQISQYELVLHKDCLLYTSRCV